MLGAVTPRNDPFAGGTLAAAASPVAVGGSFGAPGTAGFPTPSPGQAIMARNNQGTNVRIPYARLVPMRGKNAGPDATTQWNHVPGVKMRDGIVGRPIGNEYDGLDSGELAWIKGRSFLGADSDSLMGRTAAFSQTTLGFGPDRMQRLASQFYMENYFRATFGGTMINLCKINMGDTTLASLSSDLQLYSNYLAGASVLGSVDLPYLVNGLGRDVANLKYTSSAPAQALRGGGAKEGLSCGLLVVEKGPFLRGKIVDDRLVEMVAPEVAKTIYGGSRKHDVPRNLGDMVAFDALYAVMRKKGFFDWSPDGLIMSKLESPSGDPLSSSELDARQAQLFNVAIQGPAITKTWTGDPLMQVLPLDRVFVVVVADISSETTATPTKGIGAVSALNSAWDAYDTLQRGTPEDPTNTTALTNAVTAANSEFTTTQGENAAGAYAAAVQKFFSTSQAAASNSNKDAAADLKTQQMAAQADMDLYFAPIAEEEIDAAAEGLKRGKFGVESSSMTNFRLQRVTSSYLINNSAVKFKSDGSGELMSESRCGLRLGGKKEDDAAKGVGVFTGSYIIGGWCVGSVLDSAASRSVIGQQIRTAPASMAININVNIEWWSGDDLYRRYMDFDGTVLQRGATLPNSESDAEDAMQRRMAGLDVKGASLLESESFTTKF